MENTLTTLAGALVEPLALLISGAVVILLRQWLGVRIREADQAELDALVSRALAYGVDQVAEGRPGVSPASAAAALPSPTRGRAIDTAVAYARGGSPGLLKRVGATDDALAARVKAEIAARG
ncbi:hypothetical protein SAMN05444336_112134 [Albimonas donghaensis]|uniref:Bacteriophage holin of superfamily 6 (Holin_LLH) n=1 Tax=Albimonas donghaensis TaxID=356660 RepID=A0A1H3FIU8_9RHOB|nr:hypothetical protein [Albimonas donghaensis]SDX90775.1 hypothetical protein SAMN05444336_112134 [Albimonas donghaensis]